MCRMRSEAIRADPIDKIPEGPKSRRRRMEAKKKVGNPTFFKRSPDHVYDPTGSRIDQHRLSVYIDIAVFIVGNFLQG